MCQTNLIHDECTRVDDSDVSVVPFTIISSCCPVLEGGAEGHLKYAHNVDGKQRFGTKESSNGSVAN